MNAALLVYLACLPVSIAAMNVGAGLLTLSLLATRRWSWDRSWNLPLAGLAAYCLCSLLAAALSPEPGRSFSAAGKDLHKLWILVITLAAFRQARWHHVLAALGLGFAFVSLVGMRQAFFTTLDHGIWARAHGFVHPVTYGQQLALAVIGAVCLALKPGAHRRWALGLLAVAGTALILSQTRAAILGVAVGAAALALRYPPWRRRLALVGVLAVASLFIWELRPQATGGRSLLRVLRPVVDEKDVIDPHQARWVLWDASVAMFRAHPIAGVGPGRYRSEFPRYFSGKLDGEKASGSAHNLYLHQLAERGVLGLLGLAAAFGALGLAAWRRARAGGSAALWAWSGLAAFAAMNLTESGFQIEQSAALVLTVVAAGLARDD